jgi:hypothetical protein
LVAAYVLEANTLDPLRKEPLDMDLNKQPPRRPSNLGLAGIAGLARMADKARAHQAETLGEFVYGEQSGLDREILELIHMSADEFAQAAAAMDDDELAAQVLQRAGQPASAIAAFNREHLERRPKDERHRQLLAERVARFAPDRTDIETVFQSIELDDWGLFRQVDLTRRPPRTPHLRSVAGVVAAARMADKARAHRSGTLGAYKYGDDSGIDEKILTFLGIAAADFAQAAYENPNDAELTEWVRAHTRRTQAEISAFNAGLSVLGRSGPGRERFLQRRAEICPEGTTADSWLDLLDVDDERSFGLVDLTRHAPRSGYDTSLGGVTGLARMVDKGRAFLGGTLGEYWYGSDSGADRSVLEFLGVTADEFTQALREHRTDESLAAWLGPRLQREPAEVEAFNQKLQGYGPSDDRGRQILRRSVAALDPSRKDITTWYAQMQLDDQVTFARLKAGV